MHCRDLQYPSFFPLLSTSLPCCHNTHFEELRIPPRPCWNGGSGFSQYTAHLPGVCPSISPPNTPSAIHTTEVTPCEVSDASQKHTLLRQARKPERNLPVVIVSPDERLGVNDKQGKKKQGRKKKFSGKLVIVKLEGESVQMQSLHLGL